MRVPFLLFGSNTEREQDVPPGCSMTQADGALEFGVLSGWFFERKVPDISLVEVPGRILESTGMRGTGG